MTTKPRTFDCDSHIFEPLDIWTSYLEPDYRVSARTAFWYEQDEDGLPAVILNGRPAKPLSTSGINRQAIWRPGMTPEDVGGLDPERRHPINPGARDPKARLADMDAMGIDQALVLPTLFSEYFPLIDNPDAAWALARAYNDWIGDFSSAAPHRLVPAAVLPLQNASFAVRELRRVAAKGFRAACIRPSYINHRFPNHVDYDPLWTALERLGIAACIVPSPGGTNPEWTSSGSYVDRIAGNLGIGHSIAEAIAPVMDNSILLTAFAFFGHLERFPQLKVAFLHSGASWLPLALEKAETYLWLMSSTQDVSLEPEEVFFNRPSLIGFDTWESGVARLPDVFGNVAAWGSRYPQHDASDTKDVLAMLNHWSTPEAVVTGYIGANAARFFGVA
jgi:predicted TIM-barrel fold metal-dependent hydrolase